MTGSRREIVVGSNQAARIQGRCNAAYCLLLLGGLLLFGSPQRSAGAAAVLEATAPPDVSAQPLSAGAAPLSAGAAPPSDQAARLQAAMTSAPPESPASRPPGTRRAWLNRHLELHALAIVPAAGLLELQGGGGDTSNSEDEVAGRGVWTQPVGGVMVKVRARERFFASVTAYGYPRPDDREGWMPDFDYAFGYEDWRPFTFSLIHANHTGNRFPWRASELEPIAAPEEGVTSLLWRFQGPLSWRDAMGVGPDWWVGGSIGAHYAFAYDRADGGSGRHHTVGSLGLSATFWEHWFADFRAFLYPIPGQQQPWDPDFTYSVGWMDWRPWRVTVRWNNYAGNRWPGRSLEGNGGPSRGALLIDLRVGF